MISLRLRFERPMSNEVAIAVGTALVLWHMSISGAVPFWIKGARTHSPSELGRLQA